MGLFSYVNDVMEVVGYACFDEINLHRNFYKMDFNGFRGKLENMILLKLEILFLLKIL